MGFPRRRHGQYRVHAVSAADTPAASAAGARTSRTRSTASRDGVVGADEYLERWQWSGHLEPPAPEDVAASVTAELEAQWIPQKRGTPATPGDRHMSTRVLVTDYAWPSLDIERGILGEVDAELVVAETRRAR